MFRHTLDASSSHMDKGRVYGGICHEKIGIGGWDGTGIHGSLLQGIIYGSVRGWEKMYCLFFHWKV